MMRYSISIRLLYHEYFIQQKIPGTKVQDAQISDALKCVLKAIRIKVELSPVIRELFSQKKEWKLSKVEKLDM
jgi:hypothetical protein